MYKFIKYNIIETAISEWAVPTLNDEKFSIVIEIFAKIFEKLKTFEDILF